MSPSRDESHLYEQFQLWLHRPDAVPRTVRATGRLRPIAMVPSGWREP